MCGIVGYIGTRPCHGLLIEGLKRLEYRGYDSAGVALMESGEDGQEKGELKLRKSIGRVANLEEKSADLADSPATVGIAHTRWATHGGVTDANAHPHTDDQHGICLVHNGIIENYAALKKYLQEHGFAGLQHRDRQRGARSPDRAPRTRATWSGRCAGGADRRGDRGVRDRGDGGR